MPAGGPRQGARGPYCARCGLGAEHVQEFLGEGPGNLGSGGIWGLRARAGNHTGGKHLSVFNDLYGHTENQS